MNKKVKLYQGDNIQSLKKLPDNSIDSIVTDPPYALTSIKKRFGKEGSAPAQYGTNGVFQRASKGFMGKEWDAEVPSVEFWKEVYRVLKPGGHVLSFGGTRTYHRMVVNIEDAGFEIRDQIMWIYGSGFPKSHNISKQIDKSNICEYRKIARTAVKSLRLLQVKLNEDTEGSVPENVVILQEENQENKMVIGVVESLSPTDISIYATKELIEENTTLLLKNILEEGLNQEKKFITLTELKTIIDLKIWNLLPNPNTRAFTHIHESVMNMGTSLKPANEPICLARKPLSEKSVAENVLKWRTGGINIDGCRVEYENTPNPATNPKYRKENGYKLPEPGQESNGAVQFTSSKNEINTEGRFPANIIFECICDEVIKGEKGEVIENNGSGGIWNQSSGEPVGRTYNDKGDIHTNPDCPCRLLDEQSGYLKSTGSIRKKDTETDATSIDYKHKIGENSNPYSGQSGGASRYFLNIKKFGGTEDFFIYKENNIIVWNIKSLDTQEYNTEDCIEASDALKQERENICQNPELYGNNILVRYLMTTISITKMKTHSIMTFPILNASTKMSIGHFTLMIDEKKSQLLTEENILNVQIVNNQNALVSFIKTNQEVLVPIVSYVLEENLVSGETIIENTITNTTENIGTNRFFYQAKVSKAERNMGLDGFEEKTTGGKGHGLDRRCSHCNTSMLKPEDCNCDEPNWITPPKKNGHPTIKPINLMTYLCRLITPPKGIVLDPFMGSGSTGIAAQLEGFRFVGMEMDEDYFKIAEARIENFQKYKKFIK